MAASSSELASMPRDEYDRRLQKAYDTLTKSGAHYVIDSVADLPVVIDDINRRMRRGGEKP